MKREIEDMCVRMTEKGRECGVWPLAFNQITSIDRKARRVAGVGIGTKAGRFADLVTGSLSSF